MIHEIHTIKSFQIIAPYTIQFVFEDDSSKTINFLPLLKGEMFTPLLDNDYFNSAKLDTEVNTIAWPNGADFDPSILYNWDQHLNELLIRSEKWETQNR